ncbi:vanadium-dependent haloperoxidase [Lysobacter hankyongensis]|uniref:Vanadium-dependent haloperoxidase n=1 Tax=Lysobacter hankyongensis TaxID=1176535 RepID=A0ABP9CBU4_9GAMM
MKQGIRTRLALASALLVGAAGAAQSATLVTDWNDQSLQAVRATRMAPPIFARANAIVNTAMYDAWAAYDNKANGTQLGGELRRPANERTDANRRKAMSYAAYRTLVELFPTRKSQFDAEMARLGYNPNDFTGDLSTPQGVGNVAAAAVIQFRRADGSNQLGDINGGAPYSDYTGYVPINTPTRIIDPTRWQPLAVPNGSGGFNVQTFLTPHWGNVKGFGLSRYNQFAVPAPAKLGTFEFWRQSVEVVAYSATLSDRTKTIAEWWADGPGSETPPGTWILFAKQVSDRKGHTLAQDIRMHFALTNAMFDAGIAVWGYKRQYDYARPVTTIHHLFNNRPILAWGGEGQGTKWIQGQNWRPYQIATFITPPFSEHVSGHSTFSASAAEVLKLFTGSDSFPNSVVVPAGFSLVEPGVVPAQDVTLSWPTFSAAADEAGISRLYGGIHFRNGDLEGRKLGRRIGAQAYALSRAYINGTAGN